MNSDIEFLLNGMEELTDSEMEVISGGASYPQPPTGGGGGTDYPEPPTGGGGGTPVPYN